jgi:1-acyl-sn-glycerol-3-phosphate acyltransferase
MRALLLFILLLARLLWWDLTDKIRICVSWSAARHHIDRYVSWRARALFALASFTVGMRLRVEIDHASLPDQMIILANHQSVMDIVVIMAAFRHHSVRFVAKAELKRWFPAVSRVLRVQRHALVPRRGGYSTAMTEVDRLARGLRRRECPVIFPEGTRSRHGRLMAFQSGAVRRLHRQRPLPIVALALDGGWQFSRLNEILRLPRGHEFRIALAAVYPVAYGKQAVMGQIEDSRKAIEKLLCRWRSEA